MLSPKKTKYRKSHKGRRGGTAQRGNVLSFGSFGLKSTSACWVTSRQIESARRVMTRYVQRSGKMWIRIFPDKPVTQKGGEMPMGKGKGAVDHYVCAVRPGMVMFEMEGVSKENAQKAMELAMHKLPVKCKFVFKK